MDLPAQLEVTPAWREVRTALRDAVGESTFDVWLAPLEPQAWDGTVLLLRAPPATQRWVAERFGRVLAQCAKGVLGQGAEVVLAGNEPTSQVAAGRERNGSPAHSTSRSSRAAPRLIPRYTFQQFIIGDGNHLAHAAALAVAEAPGQAPNPLFLHGPPGLGKTHLLHAIGNYLAAFDGSTTVRYTTVEAFTNGFIAALQGRGLEEFKHLHRDVDVLLVDDVQFLANKAKTEEEFFHTFNAVADAGRQLVLTCDRLPRQLVGLESRLLERFEAGLVATLAPPDRNTRIAILRKRAALDRVHVPDLDVLELIADRIPDNIRSLEGALIRIVAHHSLTGHPIDLELAVAVLDEIHPAQEPPTSGLRVARIQETVAEYFALSVEDLRSGNRSARVAWPRQLAIHLARRLANLPLQSIGEAFGGRGHATVIHACKRVEERVATNVEDRATLDALVQLLR